MLPARQPGSRNTRNSRFAEPVSQRFPGAGILRQPLDFTLGAERLSSRKHRKTGIRNAAGNEWSNGNGTHEEHRPAPRPAARSAAHAAPDPGQAPGTGPAPGDPAAAVHAALTANPGATTAVIATAAGTSRTAARDALTALQTAGAVTRDKGGKPGIPDTWTLTAARPRRGRARSRPEAGRGAPGHQPARRRPRRRRAGRLRAGGGQRCPGQRRRRPRPRRPA